MASHLPTSQNRILMCPTTDETAELLLNTPASVSKMSLESSHAAPQNEEYGPADETSHFSTPGSSSTTTGHVESDHYSSSSSFISNSNSTSTTTRSEMPRAATGPYLSLHPQSALHPPTSLFPDPLSLSPSLSLSTYNPQPHLHHPSHYPAASRVFPLEADGGAFRNPFDHSHLFADFDWDGEALTSSPSPLCAEGDEEGEEGEVSKPGEEEEVFKDCTRFQFDAIRSPKLEKVLLMESKEEQEGEKPQPTRCERFLEWVLRQLRDSESDEDEDADAGF